MGTSRPESDIDLFSDESLYNPYPLYRQLRDQSGAVWMRPLQMYALTRFADVREALKNWEVFSSARGVAMNDPVNERIVGGTLGTDPPEHTKLREIVGRPLAPPEMRALTARIETEADALVERLVARKHFDAATDLAQYLPVAVISFLVGLPEEGREKMLDWGNAAFNTIGPMNARCMSSLEVAFGLIDYAMKHINPAELMPGGWATQLYGAADRGEITHQEAHRMILDYVTPSLDTTIFGISSAVWLLASHPEQWALLRDNPALIPNAINEILRLESPIQTFSRYVARDTEVDGVTLPAGSRALVVYASANRDERKWENPERFDVNRKAGEQMAFGYGVHTCIGMPLARLEMRCLLTALVKRVKSFELGEVKRGLNNTLRGFEKVEVTVH